MIGPLLDREPGHRQGRYTARNLHGTRGNILERLGRHAEAADDRGRVVVYNDDPAKDVPYRLMHATALLKAGRAPEAAGRAHDLARILGPTPDPRGDDCYNLACVLSLCSASAGSDASPEARARRDRDADAAARWLVRADTVGFLRDPANRDHARVDADLDAIRDRDDVRRCLASQAPAAGPSASSVRPP